MPPIKFDWDAGNEMKNATKHNVSTEEAESVFDDKKKTKTYVAVSRMKNSMAAVDWDKPLNLETILELSRKGLLKEKKTVSKKAA